MPATEPNTFTVIRTTCTGLLDVDGARVGTETEEHVFHIHAKDADSACDEIIASFAEADPRLADIVAGDDEYETELAIACDDVKGLFTVYKGEHTTPPEGIAPLLAEGEIGSPEYWQYRKPRPPVVLLSF
ncbi:hypothetical protein ACOI1H_21470 [Loktanella sp. DJP18]|uniref:hypothetical protein n=1 Tax=Loktanella sp. DJP18 TaxID=3409788 RepID=UPI003BB51339